MNAQADAGPLTDSAPERIMLVRERVEGLRFGVVQLVIHDGRVTQIERTERTACRPALNARPKDVPRRPAPTGGIDPVSKFEEATRPLE